MEKNRSPLLSLSFVLFFSLVHFRPSVPPFLPPPPPSSASYPSFPSGVTASRGNGKRIEFSVETTSDTKTRNTRPGKRHVARLSTNTRCVQMFFLGMFSTSKSCEPSHFLLYFSISFYSFLLSVPSGSSLKLTSITSISVSLSG